MMAYNHALDDAKGKMILKIGATLEDEIDAARKEREKQEKERQEQEKERKKNEEIRKRKNNFF